MRTTQTGSKVQLAATEQAAKTWKIVLRDDGESVTILPGEVAQINGGTPSWNFTGGTAYNAVLNLWRADDANSAWTIVDPSIGSLACATTVFSLPRAEFMHKLVADEDKTVQSVDFGELSSLTLKEDRVNVGNSYKYVHGTAPTIEGVYTYTVNVANSGGDIVKVPVKFVVSSMLQSPTPMMG